jgi:hypothetical protein
VYNPITGSTQKEYLHLELEDQGGKGDGNQQNGGRKIKKVHHP